VYRDARTAALSADSGRAVGRVVRDGARLGVDVEGQANGGNQKVLLTLPTGGTAEVLTVGDGYWLGGDAKFWTHQLGDAAAARAMRGRYASITESDATELGSFTLRTLLTDTFALPDVAALESDTDAAAQTDVDGRPVYVLGRPGGARLWVAADGSGTLLRVVGPKSERSDLTFSQWGHATTFAEPPPAKVVRG
jgi:hypothetical protein